MRQLASTIVYFVALWWIFIMLFSMVMLFRWGSEIATNRNFNLALMNMLATIVMSSNADTIEFYKEDSMGQA